MDYLPIQATSVPCERVFSSAKETDTAKRNQISPVLMEALQLLKFSLKKERLNFMAGWPTSEMAMSRVSEPAHDLGSLFVDDPDAALDTMLNDFSTYDDGN
jgi:hAT family C-terminal dimerisation region